MGPPLVESETSRDGSVAQKRPAEEATESLSDAKKTKTDIAPVLEDDLSEISDDADEILNRVEVSKYHNFETQPSKRNILSRKLPKSFLKKLHHLLQLKQQIRRR